MQPVLLEVGRIARAHGLRGRVLLVPYNPASEGLDHIKAFWLKPKVIEGQAPQAARRFAVVKAERVNLGYLVFLHGVEGKDAADALRGSEVLVDRAALPKPADDEVYAVDLVGMQVLDEAGQARGEVVGTESAGPNELLQVKVAAGEVLVPMGLIRSIDSKERRVVVESPEGLFDVEAG